MALVSPGVEVTIIDQSQYLPAPTNSIPLVIFATAENKANPNGIGVAQGTTSANAGKMFRVTSQRDLVTLYGNPFFYSTTNGTAIQGYELNEYGLLAAYSALGVTNQVFCLRADIDLASLVGQTGRPSGEPANGAYWLDTTSTTWGIYEWNAVTQQFVLVNPLVITDEDNLVSGIPAGFLGSIGSYAVVALQKTTPPTAQSGHQFFYKNSLNEWVVLGSHHWLESVPTIVGTNSNPTLTIGDTFNIQIGTGVGLTNVTIVVPGLGSNTVVGIANAINSLGYEGLQASVNNQGRLQIFSAQETPNRTLVISSGIGTVLNDLGINAGTYYQPNLFAGTSSQQPLWQTGQSAPRPSGSVWLKIGSAGNGFSPVLSEYDTTVNAWIPKTVNLAIGDSQVINSLDATGGQAIPAGTVYAQYNYNGLYNRGPIYFWERLATGPTVVTGTNTDPSFTSGPYTLNVFTTVPNSLGYSTLYTVTLADNTFAQDFVEAWQAAGIPYTTATVTTNGAIQITHTLGGTIALSDITSTGASSGLLEEAGFVAGVTEGVKYGFEPAISYTVTQASTSGSGTGAQFSIFVNYGRYQVLSIPSAGTNYSIGDTITIAGTDLGGLSPTNDVELIVTGIDGSNGVNSVTFGINTGMGVTPYGVMLSNWVEFEYTANEGAPTQLPRNNTNWFFSVADEVDVMVNTQAGWRGYRNVNFDSNGFPLPSGTNQTDPNGPIVSASEPTVQSDGTALVYGDLWIDTSDLENYPVISRWQQVDGEDKWVLIDNTDQTNPSGILFADARWSTNQNTINPANDPIPTIVSLLTSNNLDLDAPNANLYPTGMLLFNTRRSGYNVKQWKTNYFNALSFPDETLPTIKSTWVTASGLQSNGSPFMGRKAQRAMVVQSLRSVVDTNTAIRDEDNFFNLMAAPNYPELQPNMVVLNGDRGETAYILGDTPMRLREDATEIQAWATNAAGATSTGEDGLVTRNTYLGLFYPSGIALDLSGNEVAVPASHMMLRTFLRNDTIAYPWLAAAGTRRGVIDNALNIGYLDGTTGEFVVTKTRIGIRDVLYTNFINPLVFFTGNGLLNYGNKTSFNSQSALDRTNVARLVAYIRRQLTIAARPFVFEPNDAVTREQIAGVVESLFVDLVAKRGIYDYLVVCDESNNTPARIDRNELWIDVAVEPVKAAEFIYIPVRILNTGELSGA
jgi:hypothetical protein